jgi:hypothetical protein
MSVLLPASVHEHEGTLRPRKNLQSRRLCHHQPRSVQRSDLLPQLLALAVLHQKNIREVRQKHQVKQGYARLCSGTECQENCLCQLCSHAIESASGRAFGWATTMSREYKVSCPACLTPDLVPAPSPGDVKAVTYLVRPHLVDPPSLAWSPSPRAGEAEPLLNPQRPRTLP